MMTHEFEPAQQAYFEERIKTFYEPDENGCWVWKGRLNNGMPFMTLSWNRQRVHFTVRRLLYLSANPSITLKQHEPIFTTCGNPNCVNPNHLAVGYGAGTRKGEIMARALKQYFEMRDARNGKLTMKDACEALDLSFVTLRSYLREYEKDPKRWRQTWEQL